MYITTDNEHYCNIAQLQLSQLLLLYISKKKEKLLNGFLLFGNIVQNGPRNTQNCPR